MPNTQTISTGSNSPAPKKRPAIIQVSEAAASQIQNLLARRGKPSIGIRVGLKKRGCAGLEYVFEYADEQLPNDNLVTEHGIAVLINKSDELHLIGTMLDYVESDHKSGFVFINPNEKGRCGCEKSFHV